MFSLKYGCLPHPAAKFCRFITVEMKRILFVDDESSICGIHNMLTFLGSAYHVTTEIEMKLPPTASRFL